MGFPIGGDYLSITEGVLSRIEASRDDDTLRLPWAGCREVGEGDMGVGSGPTCEYRSHHVCGSFCEYHEAVDTSKKEGVGS